MKKPETRSFTSDWAPKADGEPGDADAREERSDVDPQLLQDHQSGTNPDDDIRPVPDHPSERRRAFLPLVHCGGIIVIEHVLAAPRGEADNLNDDERGHDDTEDPDAARS